MPQVVYRVDLLERELEIMQGELGGVQGSVVVSIEGLVIAAYPPGEEHRRTAAENPTDSPQVAAMAATLIAISEKVLLRLARGEIDRLLIEGDDGALIVVPAGGGAALAALVNKDVKMGITLLGLKRAAIKIAAILARRDLRE
jgi:predicted regulator of Ras-like GTPase activity (Roadblock/LC7/MglB family)